MAKIDDLAAAFTDYQNAVMAKLVDMNAKIEALSVPSGASDAEIQPVIDKIAEAKAALG
jgi:hypothetical protein